MTKTGSGRHGHSLCPRCRPHPRIQISPLEALSPTLLKTRYQLGSRAYVTVAGGLLSNGVETRFDAVWVIDTATDTVIASIPVGVNPFGVSVTSDGSKVYVTNTGDSTVSVINTATNTVTATISGFANPYAFVAFIQPKQPGPKFAGTPGQANCHGQSVSALAQQ